MTRHYLIINDRGGVRHTTRKPRHVTAAEIFMAVSISKANYRELLGLMRAQESARNDPTSTTSVHDITRHGTPYIMEWNPSAGSMQITEALHCQCGEDETCADCDTLETYDYYETP
jgi:hypothetical protein